MILIRTESGCGFLKCKVSTTLTPWCGSQGSSPLPQPDSVNTSLLISFLFQVSARGLSGSHASACRKLTGRMGANCRTQPCSQRFCSLVLGQVPGICLFKKHHRNFCCRHPRTAPETLWPALVFSLVPLEGCASLWLQIYLSIWLIHLCNISSDAPPHSTWLLDFSFYYLASGREDRGSLGKCRAPSEFSTCGTSLLNSLESPMNLILNRWGKSLDHLGPVLVTWVYDQVQNYYSESKAMKHHNTYHDWPSEL